MARTRQSSRDGGRVRLIDTATAAAMIRCTPRHIRHLVERGTLTNHGKSRVIRIDLDEIAAAIEVGAVSPEPKRGRKTRRA